MDCCDLLLLNQTGQKKGIKVLVLVINPNYQDRLQLLHNEGTEDVVYNLLNL